MGRKVVSLLAIVPVMLLSGGTASAQDFLTFDQIADREALSHIEQFPWRSACDAGGPGMHCYAKIRTDAEGFVQKFAAPQGYGPTQIQAAYKLPATGGAGKTVALVDAYHYPNAEKDLAAYRSAMGLPPCTSASGCFKQVAQDGSTNYGSADPQGCNGWAGEASLDLDMVSSACPDCNILLVEVSGASGNFDQAVNTAVQLGAVAVSNSYGGGEDSSVLQEESAYTHAGVLITASSGDNGYGPSYPATSAGVLAVGGTSLKASSSTRGWAETAWNSGGAGCSGVISKPAWQTDTGCTRRMESDVSAVGDPNTGVAVYCSGWQVVGGTSASSPIVAAAFTIMGVSTDPSYPWKNPQNFFDVVSGSDGSCTTSYMCKAGTGYDGPTGWGSPNGTLLLAGGSSSGGSSSGASSSGGTDAGTGSSSGSSSGGSSSGSGSTSSSGGSSSGSGSTSSSGASSSGSGSTSSGASSGSSGSGSSGGTSSSSSSSSGGSSSGAGGHDAGSPNGANPGSNTDVGWNPDSQPAGCGCSVVDSNESYGALAVGLGLALGLGARRRRSAR